MVKQGALVAEDQLWVDESAGLMAIVDGVSSQRGAEASRMAIHALKSAPTLMTTKTTSAQSPQSPLPSSSILMAQMNLALWQPNQATVNAYQAALDTSSTQAIPVLNDDDHPATEEPKLFLASAVVVCLQHLEDGDWLDYCHLGDSRLMVFRDGALHKLTEDHSLLQEEIRRGSMIDDERWQLTSPLRHVLTRCLGEWQTDYPHGRWRLAAKDVVLVCSDGVTHTLLHSELTQLLANNRAQSAVAFTQLLEQVSKKIEKRGLRDDVSIIMIANLAGFSTEPLSVGAGNI